MPWEIFSIPALIFFAIGFFKTLNQPKQDEQEEY